MLFRSRLNTDLRTAEFTWDADCGRDPGDFIDSTTTISWPKGIRSLEELSDDEFDEWRARLLNPAKDAPTMPVLFKSAIRWRYTAGTTAADGSVTVNIALAGSVAVESPKLHGWKPAALRFEDQHGLLIFQKPIDPSELKEQANRTLFFEKRFQHRFGSLEEANSTTTLSWPPPLDCLYTLGPGSGLHE